MNIERLTSLGSVVYIGFPIEDVLVTVNNNSSADVFDATLVYAGL